MTYFPRIISPEQDELDIVALVQSRYWHRIKFNDISAGDRILVIRTSNGTRLIVESLVSEFRHEKGAWVNSLGTPVVSYLDRHIFKSGAPRDDQSEDNSDELLGG